MQHKFDSSRVQVAHRWTWLEDQIRKADTSIAVCCTHLPRRCSIRSSQRCQGMITDATRQKQPVVEAATEAESAARCLALRPERDVPAPFHVVRDQTHPRPAFPSFTCPPLPPSHPMFVRLRSTMLDAAFHPVLSFPADAHASTLRKAQSHRRYVRSKHAAATGKLYRTHRDPPSLSYGAAHTMFGSRFGFDPASHLRMTDERQG